MSNISTWVDPLAQSFVVNAPGGAFATSIDLFFHTKDDTLPVTIQVREMFNGYPTQKVLPFSEVTLLPADINVVDLATQDPDPTLATTFTFRSPVYLQQGVEYALVIMANSTEYQLWYAGLGEQEYGTEYRISKSTYAGVLFTSQNASTWTADQNKDLKFNINRAVFDTTVTGTLSLTNAEPASRTLQKNPIVTEDGSSTIKVVHRNHGFFNPNNDVSSYVTLSGFTDTTLYNGILGSVLNGTHEITSVEQDSFTIDLIGATANGTGITGGEGIISTRQCVYNTFMTDIQHITFPGTSASWGVLGTSGISLPESVGIPYVKDAGYTPIINNKNFNTTVPYVVATSDNMSSSSLEARCTFDSARPNLSPVFDLERAAMTTVANRIDNPTGSTGVSNYNYVDGYVDETSPTGGSALTKYVSKVVTLNESSTTVKAFLKVNRPSGSFVDVYFRTGIDADLITDSDWTLVQPSESIPFTDNPASFNEIEYNIDSAADFNMFQIKIVLRSSNSSNVPVCKALRAIALA